MDGPEHEERFTRERLTELLHALSDELKERGQRGALYIVGGAAISLMYNATRRTGDVDARIESDHDAMRLAALEVARRKGIAATWLNDAVRVFIPRQEDTTAKTVISTPNLVVTGASPEFVLAMKLRAERPKDREDVEELVGMMKLDDVRTGEAIFRRLFPDREIPKGNREALERAVAARRAARPYRYSSAPGPTGSPASIQTTSISDQQARKTTV